MIVPELLDRIDPGQRSAFEDAAEKGETRRTRPAQTPALSQPRMVGVSTVGDHLAVPDIGAAHDSPPEAFDQLLASQPRPAFVRISFVDHFVEDHRLLREVAVRVDPTVIEHRGAVLDAGMGDPWLAMIVIDVELVDRAQSVVRIGGDQHLEQMIPVGDSLSLHDVVFIGHRPPDVAIRPEARGHVAKIALVVGAPHARIAALLVIGVEQDDVRLDAQLAQPPDPILEPAEINGIKPGRIPVPVPAPGANERIGGDRRHVREHAHADLVERPCLQCGERLGAARVGLQRPGISGGADRPIGRAVGIDEVIAVGRHPDRAAIAGTGGDTLHDTAAPVEQGDVARRPPRPAADFGRAEADAVHALAIVEARNRDPLPREFERRRERDVVEGIAGVRPIQADFVQTPTLDIRDPCGGCLRHQRDRTRSQGRSQHRPARNPQRLSPQAGRLA